MLKVSFRYNRKGKLNPKGKALIQMRIYDQGNERYFSTGIYLKPHEWDKKKSRVKVNYFSLEYNHQLAEWEEKAMKAYFELKRSGTVSLNLIIERLKGEDNKGDFIEFVNSQYRKNKTIEQSTRNQHGLLVKYLTRFNNTLPFQNITYQYLVNFQSFLHSQTSERHKPLHQNYIALLFRIFRGYVTEAIKQGFMSVDPFLSFKIKTVATKKEYLEPHELEAFRNVEMTSTYPNEKHSHNMFLFSCYTGLRVSDLLELKAKHIIASDEGLRLVKKPKKTKKKPMVINLPLYLLFEGRPIKIIRIYIDGKSDDDFVFPRMTIKTYNGWILKLTKRAGITKHITSHSARHTFGMQMQNSGLPIDAVKSLMAHSNISTTQVYSHLTTSTIDELLKK